MRKDERERDRPAEPGARTLEVALVHARWKNGAWAAITVAGAAFVALRMGSFGLIVAAIVVVMGLRSIFAFAKTLLHPAGSIKILEDELVLPDGLCTGNLTTMPLAELRHAYLLRRAVPWAMAAPVLVVETQRGVFEYPRDWFHSDQDARRLSIALNRRLGLLP